MDKRTLARRMLLPGGESQYADWTDRQMDRRTDARPLHYAFFPLNTVSVKSGDAFYNVMLTRYRPKCYHKISCREGNRVSCFIDSSSSKSDCIHFVVNQQ